MSPYFFIFVLVFGFCAFADAETSSDSDHALSIVSKQAKLKLNLYSTTPVKINQFNQLGFHLFKTNGQTCINSEITIAAGMPAHSHGMASQAKLISLKPEGSHFLIKGLKFQMLGEWLISLKINCDKQNDQFLLPFKIEQSQDLPLHVLIKQFAIQGGK